MKNNELARLYYREILKIWDNSDGVSLMVKIGRLHDLLIQVFVTATALEKIQFTTLFARIVFACQKYDIPSRKQFYIHAFRKVARTMTEYAGTTEINEKMTAEYWLGLKVCAESVKYLMEDADNSLDCEEVKRLFKILPRNYAYQLQPVEIQKHYAKARVTVLHDDAQREQFVATWETDPSAIIKIQYNIPERNENFKKTIAVIKQYFGFPLTLNLIDVEVDTLGVWRPRIFVVEPDYLVDVTSIAECFRSDGAEALTYLLKKFQSNNMGKALMIGNIANFFLDELIANPEADFQGTFRKVFKLNPLAFCLYTEDEMKNIMTESQKHFFGIKLMVKGEFQRHNIQLADCFIEPSFAAETFGIQGRLDLFYKNPKNDKSAIVELKSGKLFKANIYGINQNHFMQTLLYDLMIESSFKNTTKPANFILYSGLENDRLKYAPVVKSQQAEAINVRNQVLALEQCLVNLNKDDSLFQENHIFQRMIVKMLKDAKGFERTNIEHFEKVFNGMSDLERTYFMAFTSFISREHQLAKTGAQGVDGVKGVASLWLKNLEEKEDDFEILSYLKIKENKTTANDPFITFSRTDRTNKLANFRIGDIIALYPADDDSTALDNQIFKSTIIDIDKNHVIIRLRSRQLNQSMFETTHFWHIEHDLLDSSFTAMYRSLFDFAQALKPKRNLLLGLNPPMRAVESDFQAAYLDGKGLTQEQKRVFQKIIESKDYFLLWGPPGTGKTSVMLKHLVGYLLKHTEQNILLLAYTNRAVDEICEAIEDLGDWVKPLYSRIGSRFSTGERYRNQLLEGQIAPIATRKDLTAYIKEKRVFVATVSSILGKTELLQLKKFQTVMIDEASQILEPMLVGLLHHFERFVLIGDHKQLPAVVTQAENESAVEAPNLHSIGLKNLRNSLFERLYKKGQQEEWDWAFDRLSRQGRMHDDIMRFPSAEFYEGKLRILPDGMNDKQLKPIGLKPENEDEIFQKLLLSNRMLFFNTPTDNADRRSKTNRHEAELIAKIVTAFEKIYESNHRDLKPYSIGVITPYRAQIAQIRQVLQEQGRNPDSLTIDTVERYQGGARDIILISLCTNRPSQLDSLMSLSEEGVDRKLNVAITRARRHLILVGNESILKGNEIYKKLIENVRAASTIELQP
jgi:DNA replication ATP-dependent helicase Dna2